MASSLPPRSPDQLAPDPSTHGLWPWLLALPDYPPPTPLQQVVADLAQIYPAMTPWPSHIIVVDAQQRPRGALSLGLLWARQQGLLGETPALTLRDCLPWMEPVVIVSVSTNSADLDGLGSPPTPGWVVVDAEGRYLGVVTGAALGGSGGLPSRSSSIGAGRLGMASVQEQQWVMAISHALKTPLTSLLGLSTLILDHRVGPLNDRQSRYAGLMRRAIRKLIRLVNQLVDWMRLEAGQLELELAPLDLTALLETLLPTFLTSWLPDATVPPPWMATFTYHVPPHVPPLMADRPRLQQSLYGVLGYLLHRGAIPHSLTLESWGRWVGLTLRADLGEVDASAAPPWTVTLGVDVDGLETLGLALARRLCQAQGGDLVGFCSPRDGYQITLLLPLSRQLGTPRAAAGAPSTAWPDAIPPAPPGPVRLVLVVSTDGSQVVRAQQHLDQPNVRLMLATGWAEAVDLAQRLTPALVVLDQPSLTDLPSDALALLAQMVSHPRSVVVVNSPESLSLALSSAPMVNEPVMGEPPPATAPSSPLVEPLTLLILAYRGRSALVSPPPLLGTTWQTALQRQRCRLVQADDLVQARLLCRVWQPQAIVLLGGEGFTAEDWDWVMQCPELMQRPWIGFSTLAGAVPPGLVVVDGSGLLPPSLSDDLVRLIQTIQASQE